jgi:mono/diheme cytochrome c family protein
MQLITIAVCALCPLVSHAQSGNPQAGRQLVLRSCSSCHAIESSALATDAAPPFSDVARANRERPNWIRGWLMSPHPPMPQIPLSRQEIADIIAYLEVVDAATTPQSRGSTAAGLAYADQVCAQCHAIHKGERVSPNQKAPPFEAVANARGMSEMALRVWFQTAHQSMPNLVIRGRVADDLIAYILSLESG